MSIKWTRLALGAAGIYVGLLAIGFAKQYNFTQIGFGDVNIYSQMQSQSQDEKISTRKNYASTKQRSAPAGQPLGNTQKYEKIASISQRSTAFEADRARIDEIITAQQGQIQSESGTGLNGQRIVYLGVGVPAENFDAFIKLSQDIGKTTSISIVKSDKTNDYLQMRAKRTTLEKTRTALEALQSAGGSIDERINVQNRLTELEEKIQELGVSLGDFDAQNELCTVRLTLEEANAPRARSINWIKITVSAFEWSTFVYLGIAFGFMCLIIAGWMAAGLFRFVKKTVNG
jgi:opacity protein-like surface antigen